MEELKRTVWETLLEVKDSSTIAGEKDPGAVASVLDLAKAFERVSFPVVWAWATHFDFPTEILRVLCGYFELQRRVQFEKLCGGAAPAHHGDSLWVQAELVALAYVLYCRTH